MKTFEINMDNLCAECGKPGATQTHLCMKCMNRALDGKTMRSTIGQSLQKRYRQILEEPSR